MVDFGSPNIVADKGDGHTITIRKLRKEHLRIGSEWNNRAFPNVAMPHVLWELQGQRGAQPEREVKDAHDPSKTTHQWAGYTQLTPGKMTEIEFDSNVGDLVAYMQWMSEPAQATRVRLGVWVLLFMGLFIVIAWRLNATYWKDVK